MLGRGLGSAAWEQMAARCTPARSAREVPGGPPAARLEELPVLTSRRVLTGSWAVELMAVHETALALHTSLLVSCQASVLTQFTLFFIYLFVYLLLFFILCHFFFFFKVGS